MLKAQGCPKSPRDIAQEIVAGLRLSDTFIEKVTVCLSSELFWHTFLF